LALGGAWPHLDKDLPLRGLSEQEDIVSPQG